MAIRGKDMSLMLFSQPKIQPSTDAEWRVYYENRCREQRKELAAAKQRCERLVTLYRDARDYGKHKSYYDSTHPELVLASKFFVQRDAETDANIKAALAAGGDE